MEIKGFKDTIKRYDRNTKTYAKAVKTKDISYHIEEFMNMLPDKPKVIDIGCTADRDSNLLKKSRSDYNWHRYI